VRAELNHDPNLLAIQVETDTEMNKVYAELEATRTPEEAHAFNDWQALHQGSNLEAEAVTALRTVLTAEQITSFENTFGGGGFNVLLRRVVHTKDEHASL
jgi:DNA primase